jgi:hypothetical protein
MKSSARSIDENSSIETRVAGGQAATARKEAEKSRPPLKEGAGIRKIGGFSASHKEGVMGRKKAYTVQSLILCLLFNGLMLGSLYWMARQGMMGLQDGLALVTGGGIEGVSDQILAALKGVGEFLDKNRVLLEPVVFGLGGLVTLALWLSLLLAGRRLAAGEPGTAEEDAGPSDEPLKKEVKRLEKELQAAKKAASKPSPGPAIQILSILQRQGRLVDFLEEDLGLYEDAQIGAAVRSIHQGCKEALAQNVGLEAVYSDEEGTDVTIEAGFDPQAVRLTGNVQGDPPFKGVLRHRGWRVVRMDLPLKSPDKEIDWILAPAEVDIGE